MCICLCICLGVCGRVQIIYGGPWGSVLRLIEPKTACAYVSTPHISSPFLRYNRHGPNGPSFQLTIWLSDAMLQCWISFSNFSGLTVLDRGVPFFWLLQFINMKTIAHSPNKGHLEGLAARQLLQRILRCSTILIVLALRGLFEIFCLCDLCINMVLIKYFFVPRFLCLHLNLKMYY